jgi:hypothetical protein
MGQSFAILLALCLLPTLGKESDGPFSCHFALLGTEVVPPVSTAGHGWGSAGFDGSDGGGWCQTDVTERPLQIRIEYESLRGTPIGADLHVGMRGENGPVWRSLISGSFPSGQVASLEFETDVCDTLFAFEPTLYIVVRTDSFPDGEVRGSFSCTQIDPVRRTTWGRLRVDYARQERDAP